MAEGKTNLFGKAFNTIGSTDSNFIIKTKGDLKVQWGNKFIDVIKNGKIASENPNFFKIVNSIEEIKNNGIYLVEDKSYIMIEGNLIEVTKESDLYVSFLTEQKSTAKQKNQALSNIGFYYESLEQAQNAELDSGIIYVKSEQSLYIISNGIIHKYQPNFSEQTETSESNVFEDVTISDLKIYKQGSSMYIDTPTLRLLINNKEVMYYLDGFTILSNISIKDGVFLQSEGAFSEKGFRLYTKNGESFLEVDNIIWRNNTLLITYDSLMNKIKSETLEPSRYYIIQDFQNPWEVSWETEPLYYKDYYVEIESVPVLAGIRNASHLLVQASSKNTLNTVAQFLENPKWIAHYDPYYQGEEHIISQDNIQYGFRKTKNNEGNDQYLSCKGQITYLKDEFGNEGNFNFRQLMFEYDGSWRYCVDNTQAGPFGNFAKCSNNKFYINKLQILTQVFQFIPQKQNDVVTGYTMQSANDNVRISLGYKLKLQGQTITNNYFSLDRFIDDEPILLDINSTIISNNIFQEVQDFIKIKNEETSNNKFINLLQELETEFDLKSNVFQDMSGTITINAESINNTFKNFAKGLIINIECEDNIISKYSGETDFQIQGEEFNNNCIEHIINKLENSKIFNNNTITNCDSITNEGSVINNKINDINNSTIGLNGNVVNNKLYDLESVIINGEFSNNFIKESINNCEFTSTFTNNISLGSISDCRINVFSKNRIYDSITDLNSSDTITDCVFNHAINQLICTKLINCQFDFIDNLQLTNDVYYTTFHGNISNPDNLSQYEYQLLGDSLKKKEAFPNIKIVCIPDLYIPGMIVMWSGTAETIPEGWAICDGTNGTPNLIDKFIKASNEANNTGGNKEITLSINQLPSHSHTLSGTLTTTTNGGHSHSYQSASYGSAAPGENQILSKSQQYSTGHAGDHDHTMDLSGGRISDVGNGDKINIEPEYYSLIFIMKLDY